MGILSPWGERGYTGRSPRLRAAATDSSAPATPVHGHAYIVSLEAIVVSAPAIELSGVVKDYWRTRALAGIDLTVERGRIFGFLRLQGGR
jgi:hypothetical protein